MRRFPSLTIPRTLGYSLTVAQQLEYLVERIVELEVRVAELEGEEPVQE